MNADAETAPRATDRRETAGALRLLAAEVVKTALCRELDVLVRQWCAEPDPTDCEDKPCPIDEDRLELAQMLRP